MYIPASTAACWTHLLRPLSLLSWLVLPLISILQNTLSSLLLSLTGLVLIFPGLVSLPSSQCTKNIHMIWVLVLTSLSRVTYEVQSTMAEKSKQKKLKVAGWSSCILSQEAAMYALFSIIQSREQRYTFVLVSLGGLEGVWFLLLLLFLVNLTQARVI